jgi:hypothetical protein
MIATLVVLAALGAAVLPADPPCLDADPMTRSSMRTAG